MIIKHSTDVHSSEVMMEFERQEIRKGHYDLKPDEIVRLAARDVIAKSNLKPSDDWDQDMAKLITALNKSGYKKNAEDIAHNYLIFKQAQNCLYGVSNESNEDLANLAHSDGDVAVADAKDDNGKVETIMSAAKKIREIAEKNPTGKTASSKKALSKTAQDATNPRDKVRGVFERIGGLLSEFSIPNISYANVVWNPPNPNDPATLLYCRSVNPPVLPQYVASYTAMYQVLKAHANAMSVASVGKAIGNLQSARTVAQNLKVTYAQDQDETKEYNNIATAIYNKYVQLFNTIWGARNSKYIAVNQQISTYINNITAYIKKQGERLIDPNEWKRFNVQPYENNEVEEVGVDRLLSSVRAEVVKTLNSDDAKYVSALLTALGQKDVIKDWLNTNLRQIDAAIGELGLQGANAQVIEKAKTVLSVLWSAKQMADKKAKGSSDSKFLSAVIDIIQQLTDGRIQSFEGVNRGLKFICNSYGVPETNYQNWDQLFADLNDLFGQEKTSSKINNIIKSGKMTLPSKARPASATPSTSRPAVHQESMGRKMEEHTPVEKMQLLVSRLAVLADESRKSELDIKSDGNWGPKTTKALTYANEITQKILEKGLITTPTDKTQRDTAANQNVDVITKALGYSGIDPNTGVKYAPLDELNESRGNYPGGANTEVYPGDLRTLDSFYSFVISKLGIKPEQVPEKTIEDIKNIKPTDTHSTEAGANVSKQMAEQARSGQRVSSQKHNLVRIAEALIRKGQAATPAVPTDYNPAAQWITAKQFSAIIDWFTNRAKMMLRYATDKRLPPSQIRSSEWYANTMGNLKSKWDSIKGGIDIYAKIDPAYFSKAPSTPAVKEESVSRTQPEQMSAPKGRAGQGIGLTPAQVNDGPFAKDYIDFYKLASAYAPTLIPWMNEHLSTAEVGSGYNGLGKAGDGNAVCPLWVEEYKRSGSRYTDRDFLANFFYVLQELINVSYAAWKGQTEQLADSSELRAKKQEQRSLREFWTALIESANERISSWAGGGQPQQRAWYR